MIYSVSTQLYQQTAEALLAAIGDKNYFSGAVEVEASDGVTLRLVVSCVIYRRRVMMPEGEAMHPRSVIPVWWECHTTSRAGELDNDFSFRELQLENLD